MVKHPIKLSDSECKMSVVKTRFNDIMLFLIVVLLLMLAFSAGYITAKYQTKEPLKIQQNNI